MKEIGPTAGIDFKNTVTEINHAKGIDCQSIKKMIMKESIIAHFRTMEIGNRRKYKDHYKDKYRDENFYDSDRSYDTDNSHGRDRHMTETGHIVETGTTPKNTKETGHILETIYDRNDSYSKDRL